VELPLDLTRTLAVVVAAGSLEAAAGRLQVTPSAVSQRLKALESQLGRVLLVRTKPVQPTAAGQALIRLARQLDALEHDTLAELGLTESGPVEVPLAVNADSLATWFLPALAPLAARGVVFDLHRDDQDFTAGLLESGTVSAAVTSSEHPVAGCSVRRLGAMRYLPVATPAFAERWFGSGEDAEAYQRAPLLDFDRRDGLQTRYLASVGADPLQPPRHHVPASNDFARACELGFGWALVPEHQSVPALRGGRLVRLAGAPVDVPLFWQRWKLRSPLLEQIEEAVVTSARAALHG
jgi:LysR family transcriptional regulator, chromosome initiation inhibitor